MREIGRRGEASRMEDSFSEYRIICYNEGNKIVGFTLDLL